MKSFALESILKILIFVKFIGVSVQNSCQTPENALGKCVPIQQCISLVKLLRQQPLSITNRQYLQKSNCGFIDRTPKVCCAVNGRQNQTLPLPYENACGWSPFYGLIREERTRIDDFPWTALILYQTRNEKKLHPRCEGTLLNQQYVLTAAHCVKAKNVVPKKYKPVTVRLGDYDTTTDKDCDNSKIDPDCVDEPIQEIAIESTIVHPSFDANANFLVSNDIALLRLQNSVTYNFYVRPVCLAHTTKLRTKNLNGLVLNVVGWPYAKNVKSPVKLNFPMTIVSMSNCRRYSPNRNSWAYQICGQGEANSTCATNTGGGLFKEHVEGNLNFWYLAGVVSQGNCGKNRVGLFTKVTEYYDWIVQNVQE